MQTIGLTGGIGAGKSTVARILKCMGYPVYIADTEAFRLIIHHPEIRKEMIARFGLRIYDDHGYINKPLLAGIIFDNTKALADINHIVHPRVMEDFREWCRQQKSPLVFFESAILFEAGLDGSFRRIVCVTAPLNIRLQRVVHRDHTNADKVKVRIQNQMDDDKKCKQSDFIIYNDEEQMLIRQILSILQKLEAVGFVNLFN